MKIKILLAAAVLAVSLAGTYAYRNIAAASDCDKVAYRQAMGNLLCNIKEYGQKHGSENFFVIANGGAGLLESNELFPKEDCDRLKAHLDGVMAESVNYGWDMSMDNPMPAEEQENYHRLLANAQKAGIVPMVLDYCKEKAETQKAYREDRDYGYLGWVSARRDLDRLPKELPNNSNAGECRELSQAKNYLVLLNPEAFASKEAYIASLAASNYDLLIIDAYYGASMLTPEDIARIQHKPNGCRRLVAAYMSVGEAEEYRPYWQEQWKKNPPSWMWHANSDWEGSYRVKYWNREWQQLLMGTPQSYLDQILAAGFDGAFLDVVDVFYAFEDVANQQIY